MTALLNELSTLCVELRSEKLTTRNKAADRLDQLLINSKADLLALYRGRSTAGSDVSWAVIFNSAVGATLKHAAKVDESQDSKSIQTLRNKNYVFSGIVTKLMDYNLEEENHFLPKSTIFTAFTDGLSTQSAIKHFGNLFLSLLERGIYKSPFYVRDLKVNEYSRILSYLFEINVGNDENLRFAMLRSITKTIELAVEHVQIGADLIDYLPEVLIFVQRANDDRRKAEVIRLFYLFVSQLTIDYHHTICMEIQELLPLICGFYDFRMKAETKQILFNSTYISLCSIYPHINKGDFNTFNISLKDTWTKTLKMLKTMIDMEIKERKLALYRAGQDDKCLEHFVKMSAVVMYLIYWLVENKEITEDDLPESRRKIQKTSDKLDVILELIKQEESTFNEIWFAILTEMISTQENILDHGNYQQVLQTAFRILQIFTTANHLRYLRICFRSILRHEQMLISTNCIPVTYCCEIWTQIIDLLLADSSSNTEIIFEKQLLLQALIAHSKLSPANCDTLLQSFMANTTLRRTECIATVQNMLINADNCGLDKTSETLCRFITWAYETSDRINAKSALLNIAPVDAALLADTCAIAVINFLNEGHIFSNSCDIQKKLPPSSPLNTRSLQLLLYKHNRQFVCFEEHAQAVLELEANLKKQNEAAAKTNCLLQSNYELLMRVLNIKTTNETTAGDILLDLSALYKMACLMKAFLKYSVFDSADYTQCPLIKRIGFFLSHLEFQLKNNDPRSFERSELLDILQRLEEVFNVFTSENNLWQYLENQPLEELVEFLGKSLKYSATQLVSSEFVTWSSVTSVCLKILATLCSSRSHYKDTFVHISRYKFNIRADLNIILELIEIFCTHNIHIDEIAEWFVDQLKTIFKLYYTHIETINKIVETLPAIFEYVILMEDPRQNMLIALISLLKIAYKKSYSTLLTAKLIGSVRLIAPKYRTMWDQDNFKNICLSVAKFLPFQSLEIQFSSINTITALLDLKWLNLDTYELKNKYFDFYQQLISHIDWKGLPATTIDLKENNNAVTIQVLVSMLVFSTSHQEIALQELANFCALRKLTAADLHAFHQVAEYYKCTLAQLTKNYVGNLIDDWTAKLYPILKFPYFLCCTTKDEFFQQNLPKITSCLLLNGKVDDLSKLKKYATMDDMLKAAMSCICATNLPNQVACPEANQSDYRRRIGKLNENLNIAGISLPNCNGVSSINWEIIYRTVTLLHDDSQFLEFFGFSAIFTQPAKCFNIKYSSLKRCLHLYINGSTDENNINTLFANVIARSPLDLVQVFGALKENCLSSVFAIDRLNFFYLYCITAEMVVDSIPPTKSTAIDNSANFFVRDQIFFTLHCLQRDNPYEVKKASLVFLRRILEKPIVAVGFCSCITRLHLSDIIKALVAFDDKSESVELVDLAINLISFIIIENKDQFREAIQQLEEIPMTERYAQFRAAQLEMQSSCGFNNFHSVLKSFIQKKTTGIEGLKSTRQYVSKNKSQLQLDGKLLYDTVKRLLKIVRNSSNTELSLEAVKVLGEIGSLKIEDASYYFQTVDSQYEDESISSEPLDLFRRSMLVVLDKLLLVFKAETHGAVCEVAQLLITSRGEKLIGSFPYFNVFCSKTISTNFLDSYASIENVDWVAALKSTETLEYDIWICTFLSKIFEMCGWKAFQELAMQDSYFATASLQPLIKLLLSNKERHLDNITTMLEYFFLEFSNNINSGSKALNCKTIFKEKRVISKLLNICECIRIHNEWKLPINLLLVAKACNYCQAYFMSIMYLEMWAMHEKSISGEISKTEIMVNDSFQESAKKAYESIGCTDAISGFLNPIQSRLDFLNLNNNWSDVMIEAGASQIADQLYTSILKRNGMLSQAGLNQTNKTVDYEVCWRLCQWNTTVEGHSKINTLNDMEQEFEKHHFNALKSLFNREENNSLAAIANARQCVLSILREISVECLQSVYKYLTWLQLLQQTEEFCQVQFATVTSVHEIFENWQVSADLQYGNFNCKEQILSHQIALFNTAGIRANRKITDYYKENPTESCLLKCVRECKNAGEINLTKRNIASLRNMELSCDQMRATVLLEDAEVCLKTGKSQITVAILKHLLKNKDTAFCLHRVRALRMHGEYLMESNADTFEAVLQSYFNASMDLIQHIAKSKEQILQKHPNFFDSETFEDFERNNKKCAYDIIAKYADKEYNQLNTYAKSDEFQMKCKIIQKNRQAADSIGKLNKDRDKNVGAVYMKKFANLDEQEVQSVHKKLTDNLCIAVENYMNYCKVDMTASSPAIYRIIAMWFANKQNEELLAKIRANIASVPSYKFVCALSQMTARLNSTNSAFIDVLKELLVQCALDHPHHTLYQLYPLVYAFADSSSSSTITKSHNRVQIAKEIIAMAKNKLNVNCTKQIEYMFPALIEFANFEVGDNKSTSIALSDKLQRIKNLDAVQCPTLELPISVNKNYNITGIVKWEDKITLVGGINAPKKLKCLCTDGKTRPQLLKGKDDLRQDAVMQQVFTMINDLLKEVSLSMERKLMLRTYKVVPLSMRSGILEWCQNTIPIGLYLTGEGKGGAHKKYHPREYPTTKCRILAMQHLKSDSEKRYQVYKHICENIQPVFHYFLFEKFLVPGVWFERRLAYTNSVATTSIVGFILGLGDRHVQNILIDEQTAEVIHIDFGIAFDQGKIMPTPETVPFRLTRDMVAPMGVCETNGAFKKSCEITMQVLRSNQAVITTILEVLLYDPLYIWKVVPQNVTDEDETEHEETNLTAQRALLFVQNKLEGKQPGILGASEINVQVQRLINDAISSRNLCQLFPGWDPYL